jgi:drug/metabolite transporter (DMT)-like permease
MEKNTQGIICVLLSMVLFSTGGIFIKLINANAFTITFGRAIIAGLVFLPFMQWKKIRLSKKYLALAFSYSYLCIMFVLTTKITTAANAIILQCTAPLWLYLFYLIKGKKITSRELVPRIFILLGIIAILSASDGGNFYGNLLALTNGIAYAMVQYFMEKDYPFSDKTMIGLNNIFLSVIVFVLMFNQLDFSSIQVGGWLGLIFLGVVQMALAYLFFAKGIKLISALKASMVSLLEPILNPIFVFVFIGEMPSELALVGFGLVMFGVGLTIIPLKKEINEIEYQNK